MPRGIYPRPKASKKTTRRGTANGHANGNGNGNGKSLRSRVIELSRENSDLRSQLQKAKLEAADTAAAALRTIDRALAPRVQG